MNFITFVNFQIILFLFLSRKMERHGMLNPDDDADLYCLHLVFVPLIQQFMDDFLNAWNLHPLRTTVGRRSPTRLYLLGLTEMRRLADLHGVQPTELKQVKIVETGLCIYIDSNSPFVNDFFFTVIGFQFGCRITGLRD